MKIIKALLILFALPILAFTTTHKFYTSVTQVEYIKEKQSVQIITRIFIDDLEALLRKRYDEDITLEASKDEKQIDSYIERYLKSKIQVNINSTPENLVFVGKEYEDDIVYCYLEIKDVSAIHTFEISNQVFFDLFDEQQNIVKTNINSKHKSFILIHENDKGMLNFD
jgi:hypothetical protein